MILQTNHASSLTVTNGNGSTFITSTPSELRTRGSITSDFDTSSILDSVSLNNMSMNNDSHDSSHLELNTGEKKDHSAVISTIVPTPTPSEEKPLKKKEKRPHLSTKHSPPPDPIPSISIPSNKIIVTTAHSPTSPTSPVYNSRSFSVTGDDIEAAFDAIATYKSEHQPTSTSEMFHSTYHNNHDYEIATPDAIFGLSSIPEDHDEIRSSIYDTKIIADEPSTNTNPDDVIEEIDFDRYFKQKQHSIAPNKIQNETLSKKQEKQESSKRKGAAPRKEEPLTVTSLPPKSVRAVPEEKVAVKEAQKTSTNISAEGVVKRPAPVKEVQQQAQIKIEQSSPKLSHNNTDSIEDDDEEDDHSVDDDVNEIVSKLETSAILPLLNDNRPSHLIYSNRYDNNNNNNIDQFNDDDIPTPNADVIIIDGPMKYSDQIPSSSSAFRNNQDKSGRTGLPDIVIEQNSRQTQNQTQQQPVKKGGLNVLGYNNVNSAIIQPKIRKELEYLDREELLHLISHQNDLVKKKENRLKDLEGYVDGLLMKILEQCPTILQVGAQY
ncbi:unnamed protein product [Didymodactylos carnosus]|uniref:FIP-RBD domain-containing protein n=1 Tax=Didymodactylos carnosus TaxID=1234261 RepID=A0A8S2H1S4_9BILA|nr:unnamed protein product [Didymodactylos carnosus]CAF3588470.1 unnamed protein product [Didymodactylos carnosus]